MSNRLLIFQIVWIALTLVCIFAIVRHYWIALKHYGLSINFLITDFYVALLAVAPLGFGISRLQHRAPESSTAEIFQHMVPFALLSLALFTGMFVARAKLMLPPRDLKFSASGSAILMLLYAVMAGVIFALGSGVLYLVTGFALVVLYR